ncbi:MAG TPA: ThiF family adenylyltransferase [Candidatus Methylomirabilis sp.]|nr:ThiF family adenylyltransferase [Candidatus Methylomirabilis sp.]
MLEIKVIGLGGIGCALLPPLSRYLYHAGTGCRLTLVDGDAFEQRNLPRQGFRAAGNKARVKAEEVAQEFPGLSVRAVPEFVSAANAADVIQGGNVVFLGVDNHRTRKVVSDHCERLTDILLISGGNEWTDGNVQVYCREGGWDLSAPLTRFHPEIALPGDGSPADASCDAAAAAGAPQLLFTNLAVASAMLNAFYAWQQGGIRYGEVYLDILAGRSQPVERRGSRE